MLFDCKTSQNIIGQDKFLKAFENILNHGAYCQGPETKELDEKLAAYSGVKYCSTCGSGTDALTLALMAWGVKEGDAVFRFLLYFRRFGRSAGFAGAQPRFSWIPIPTLTIWIRKTCSARSTRLRKKEN